VCNCVSVQRVYYITVFYLVSGKAYKDELAACLSSVHRPTQVIWGADDQVIGDMVCNVCSRAFCSAVPSVWHLLPYLVRASTLDLPLNVPGPYLRRGFTGSTPPKCRKIFCCTKFATS